MRKCPVRECLRSITHGNYVCWAHWQRLPQHVKDHLSAASHRYKHDEISCAELRSVVAEVVANLQGTDVDRVEDAPRTTPAGRCKCGKEVLFPLPGVPESPWTTGPVAPDKNGPVVVVGGRIELETDQPVSYTRFSYHWCPNRITGVIVELKPGPQFKPRGTYAASTE